jgi:DNA polymerase-3 subunit epsilon
MSAPDDYRQQLRDTARAWLARRPLYLDTETTGLGPTDEVIEVAVIEHDGSPLVDLRVRPFSPIPPEATRVHGITAADVADAPSFAEIAPALARALSHRTLVIYNAAYDLRLLAQSARRHACQCPAKAAHCAMKLYAVWYGDWNPTHNDYRWKKLANAAAQMSLAIDEPLHSARADAALTRRLLHAIADAD